MHRCPIEKIDAGRRHDCQPIEGGAIMCKWHWSLLPAELATRLTEAKQLADRAYDSDAAQAAYVAAKRDATAAVMAKLAEIRSRHYTTPKGHAKYGQRLQPSTPAR